MSQESHLRVEKYEEDSMRENLLFLYADLQKF